MLAPATRTSCTAARQRLSGVYGVVKKERGRKRESERSIAAGVAGAAAGVRVAAGAEAQLPDFCRRSLTDSLTF
eukprot:3730508-Heterocapsa_arctica.AAC.2